MVLSSLLLGVFGACQRARLRPARWMSWAAGPHRSFGGEMYIPDERSGSAYAGAVTTLPMDQECDRRDNHASFWRETSYILRTAIRYIRRKCIRPRGGFRASSSCAGAAATLPIERASLRGPPPPAFCAFDVLSARALPLDTRNATLNGLVTGPRRRSGFSP